MEITSIKGGDKMTTKEKIKKAALSLFSKNGYEGTALSEIAKQVGIKKPSIYNHFDSKEDIFIYLFEDSLMWHVNLVKEKLNTNPDWSSNEKLFNILDLTIQTHIDDEENFIFLKRALLFPPEALELKLREKFLSSEAALTDILKEIFLEGIENETIKKEEIDNLIISYLCLIDGLFVQIQYYGKDEIKPRLKNVWNNYWFGIKK